MIMIVIIIVVVISITVDMIDCLLQTSMLQSIERYMKQAIVDKVPGVSSAALVSALVSASFCWSFVASRMVQDIGFW